jgi:tRNA modification GTPase
VLAARHAGVRVLGLSIVANVFQDVASDEAATPDETTGDAVVAQVAETAPRLGQLLQQVICSEWAGEGQGGGRSTETLEGSPAESATPASRATMEAHALSAALLTAAGRGAVAVIRVASSSGAGLAVIDRHFRAANGCSIEQQEVGALCYGVWSDFDAAEAVSVEAEDIVVCRTSSGAAEIHCHGGPAAIERILRQLEHSGVRRADWRDQLHDLNENVASPSGRTAAIDVECFDAMTRATTERAALLLLRQSRGVLRAEIEALIAQAGSDWSPAAGQAGGDSRSEVAGRLRSLLERADFGIHLAEPWRVVLAGRPNVGKSTLLNALLGYSRAIVFDEPGTTRDVVTGETAVNGWPFAISDTAGVRETGSELEQKGIRRTRRSIADADLVCLLLDTSALPTDEDRALLVDLRTVVPDGKLLIVAHKSDRLVVWGDEIPGDALPVSSTTGEGIDQLAAAIVERTVDEVPDAELAVPVTRQQVLRLQEALAAAEQSDWIRVVAALMDCRDGYRPLTEGTP